MNRSTVIAVIVLTALLCGCRLRHNAYSDFRTFDNARWAFSDTAVFIPELDDSIAEGPLTICVRHTNAYPYSNLWIEMEYAVGDTATRTDTLQLKLADDFGRWYGKGSGVSFQFADTAYRNFRMFGRRPLKIRNIMRRDTLAEIEQIGIIFGE